MSLIKFIRRARQKQTSVEVARVSHGEIPVELRGLHLPLTSQRDNISYCQKSKWITVAPFFISLMIVYLMIGAAHVTRTNGQVLSFPRLLSNLHHTSHHGQTSTVSRSQHQQQRQQRQTTSASTTSSTSSSASPSSSSTTNSGSSNNNNNSSSSLGGWHFPRLSQEQAADVILTGVQVIGKIAQAETSLNFCRTPDGQDGECSDIRKCLWLMLDRSRLRQSVCLRNLIIPAVCCPTTITNNNSNSSGPNTSSKVDTSNNNNATVGSESSLSAPTLLKAKAPRKRKPIDHHQLMRPNGMQTNMSHNQLISGPPLNPASLIIRNPLSSTSTTTTTTAAPDNASQQQQPHQSGSPHQSVLTVTSSAIMSSSHGIDKNLHQTLDGTKQNSSSPSENFAYPWTNGTCGEGSRLRTGRIVGGSDSKLGQWPWMSAIYLSKNHGMEFWCGGALINNKYILTAAHCLSDQRGNKYLTEQITVKLGGVDLVKHQAPPGFSPQTTPWAPANSRPATTQTSTTAQQDHLQASASSNNPLYSDEGSILDQNNHNELSITQILSKALLGSAAKAFFQHHQLSSRSSSSSMGQNIMTTNDNGNSKQQQQHHYFNEYKATAVKQHPKFQRHGFYNDIGLIELSKEVQFDEHIQPICLPGRSDLQRDFTGYMATVLGWGTLSYGGASSKSLQQVTMPIWTNKDCDDRYLQPIGKTFLCAGFLQGGKDACQGDSGGPLMISDASGRWTLHGIVSFGKTCAQAGYPGVYTKVTEYLEWIKENIQ